MSDTSYFYLSFADDSGWLGAAYVPGHTIIEAASAAWAYGCNPGGEVMGLGPFDASDIPMIYRHRLLSREDLIAVNGVDDLVRITPEEEL